uniref:LPXTG cell wall anchor domain-containing protein n=2 Tax=Streptomyces TaxID=1883 RepID=J1RZ85_9ACTN
MATGGGLAAGSVLMLGGLGAGAYMLRRRNTSGASAA